MTHHHKLGHHHQGLYSLLTEELSRIDPTGVCALLILTIRVRSVDEIISISCFWTTLLSGPIYWGPLCCSDGPTIIRQPGNVTCPSMLCFPDSVDYIAYASFLVFRFPSRRVMLSIMCSILRCATVGLSVMALFNSYVSQPYVITGKMYSSCIFLFILMLALRLLRMLSTSPTLPNQVHIRTVILARVL